MNDADQDIACIVIVRISDRESSNANDNEHGDSYRYVPFWERLERSVLGGLIGLGIYVLILLFLASISPWR